MWRTAERRRRVLSAVPTSRPPVVVQDEHFDDAGTCFYERTDARALRRVAQSLTTDEAINGCGRTIPRGPRGSAGEVLRTTIHCGRKWLCPMCAFAESKREEVRVHRRLRGWTRLGGSVALLTLSQCHTVSDGLEVLWDRSDAAWSAVTQGSGWRRDRQQFGIKGFLRFTEVVHTPKSGWNVHSHVLLLLTESLSEGALAGLKTAVAHRHIRSLRDNGGGAELTGQDIREMQEGTEYSLAGYLTKGTQVRRRSLDGSRTPMAILEDVHRYSGDLDLWNEYSSVVSGTRKVQFTTSKKIDELCGLTDDGRSAGLSVEGRELLVPDYPPTVPTVPAGPGEAIRTPPVSGLYHPLPGFSRMRPLIDQEGEQVAGSASTCGTRERHSWRRSTGMYPRSATCAGALERTELEVETGWTVDVTRSARQEEKCQILRRPAVLATSVTEVRMGVELPLFSLNHGAASVGSTTSG